MKSNRSHSKSHRLHSLPENNRWKWMAGATATAAGLASSQAGLVTINLVNNYISAIGGNHLNADLTGDGVPDITISHAYVFHRTFTRGTHYVFSDNIAAVVLNGVDAAAFAYGDGGGPVGVRLGSQFKTIHYTSGVTPGQVGSYLTGSIPISFKDLHLNGGALTHGSLEVTVSALRTADGSPTIQLDSFTYRTPDKGSSLGLLAAGVVGLLALRRWRGAQAKSQSIS
jgi:hypothetical protein